MAQSSPSRWPQTLADLDLFSECSARDLRRIGSLLTGLQVPAGSVLINEGSIGLEFLVIVSGQAAVTVDGRPVATLGAGDFIGEMALLNRVPRSATVRAITPLTFYVSNTAEFATLLEIAPGVRAKIHAAAERRSQANTVAA
ncbi:MAG: hypothetical protein NVSMB12_03760 [Acidimicrobiales bacterium]